MGTTAASSGRLSGLRRCRNRTCFTHTLTCSRLVGYFYGTCSDSRRTRGRLNIILARRCGNGRIRGQTALGRSCRFMLDSLSGTARCLGMNSSFAKDLCGRVCFGRCAYRTLHTHMSLCVRGCSSTVGCTSGMVNDGFCALRGTSSGACSGRIGSCGCV